MEAYIKIAKGLLATRVPYVGFSYTELLAFSALWFWFVYPAFKYLYSIAKWLCRRKQFAKGDWAIVTGSTDGIGKAYAKDLIRKGMNVLLIARNSEKLKDVATELQKDGIEIATHAADFSSPNIYTGIEKVLKGKNVSILINNVGVSYPYAMYFHEFAATSTKQKSVLLDMINTNLVSMVEMTALVLPGMLERRKGGIINISSAAGLAPTGSPLLALYSATKAAANYFSESLNSELEGKGITVESHVPYFVTSKLSKIKHPSLFTPTPRDYAASSLGALGGAGAVKVPYWSHALQHTALHALPLWASDYIQKSMHLDIRRRGQAKERREAEKDK